MAFNWGGAAQGGLGGAASGATLGSFGGPIGTAIGAGVGGLAGLLGGGLAKNKDPYQQAVKNYSPDSQAAIKMLLSQGTRGLEDPYAGFEPIATLARKDLQTKTLPSIAERFSSIGSGGSQKSSAYEGLAASAGADLETQLAALRAGYGLQNRTGLLNMLQLGLSPESQNEYFGEEPGFGGQLLNTGANIAGNYLASGGDFGVGNNKPTQRAGGELNGGNQDQLIKLLTAYISKGGKL